jgi:hypothetical protein
MKVYKASIRSHGDANHPVFSVDRIKPMLTMGCWLKQIELENKMPNYNFQIKFKIGPLCVTLVFTSYEKVSGNASYEPGSGKLPLDSQVT